MNATLEEAASPSFPRDQYLLPSSPGRPRVSSWVDGRQRALMFFWENPRNRRVYMIRTQAPYITEILQRFFGTTVDGRFGEFTRRAIVNYARAHGVNFAPNTAATGQLLAYALQVAVLNGGRVAFPPSMDYPDTNHPVLATNPENRRYSTMYALELDTGMEAPLDNTVVNPPQTHSLTTPTNTTPTVPTANTTSNVTQVQQQSNVFSGNTVNFPGISIGTEPQGGVPSDLGQWQAPPPVVTPAPSQQTINPFLRPLPADGKCPKGFVPVGDGTCKLEAFIRFEGRLLLPNPGDIIVEYGKPETYAEAFPWLKDKTKEKV